MSQLERLTEAVAGACPIDGLFIGTPGVPASVRIDYRPEATPGEQAAAAVVVAAFDWSPAAQTAWEAQREIDTALAEMSEPLSGQQRRVIRAVVGLLVDELNVLRGWLRDFKSATAAASNLATLKTGVAALPNLPDRTVSQAKTAVSDRINAAGD